MSVSGKADHMTLEDDNTPDQTCTHCLDPPYVLRQGSEPIGRQIILLLNLAIGGTLVFCIRLAAIYYTWVPSEQHVNACECMS